MNCEMNEFLFHRSSKEFYIFSQSYKRVEKWKIARVLIGQTYVGTKKYNI